ncbi:MAG: hypothetical protein HXX11_22840 [Desulfuromonadales bacterium]|nr:hypothetical protein [Desulfuromonadales bacterium]
MNTPDTRIEIQTLGSFNISADGKPIASTWPDKAAKVLFCSLFSPLAINFTWDRICRSLLGVSESLASRQRLEKNSIVPLSSFLIEEFGFNPLITSHEGIRIDFQRIHVDAFEFHTSALEGLNFLSRGNRDAAFEKLRRAKSLYNGSYLPGITSKIITNTRFGLESLYRTAVINAMPLTGTSCSSGRNRRKEPALQRKPVRKTVRTLNYGHENASYDVLENCQKAANNWLMTS